MIRLHQIRLRRRSRASETRGGFGRVLRNRDDSATIGHSAIHGATDIRKDSAPRSRSFQSMKPIKIPKTKFANPTTVIKNVASFGVS